MASDIVDEFDNTCTVTVALDLDGIPKAAAKPISFFDTIGPPARAVDMFVSVDSGIMISDVPLSIRQILCTHLDVRAAGSMRNWERIGQQLGMHINAIDALRVPRSHPTEGVLQFAKSRSISFLRFLMAIRDENRVDTLIALRGPLFQLNNEISDSGGLERWQRQRYANNDSAQLDSFVSRSVDLAEPALPRPRRPPPSRFILITHHEENAAERKGFKHLLKNIQLWGVREQIEALDIEKCIDESNIQSSFTEVFSRARRIAVVITRAYKEHVLSYSDQPNQLLQIKRNLHQNMDLECSRNQGNNLRFRVILLAGSDKQYVPIGWALNTFQYTFPEQHEQIAKKLFHDENSDL